MTLRIGQTAPDFEATTTAGAIRFHEWIGDSWVLLFSHPKDFTPVCTTELAEVAKLQSELGQRNCKAIGISVDPVDDHSRWAADIEQLSGASLGYPLIGDPTLEVAKAYGMLPVDAGDSAAGRTPADNATVRTVFLIGPDKLIKAMIMYPMTTGRNFDEILRLLDSCQLTAREQVATPVNWRPGDDVVIAPAVSDDDASKRYPQGWRSPLPYLRLVTPSDD
ncbi:MAG: peroxiredoxin [Pseudomonadota bacterium]